jgi:N-acetylglucosamine-6-phosphate deacetylase
MLCCYPVAMIDLHLHGISGIDTRNTSVSEIIQIAQFEYQMGIAHIVLSLYPAQISSMRENLETIKQAMEIQTSEIDYENLMNKNPKPARIIGVHIEGPFLNPHRAGALDNSCFIVPSERNFCALIEGYENEIVCMTISPELAGATRLTKFARNMGIAVNMGHSDATWSEAEDCFHAGATGITHLFNAMRPFHHREPGIAGFGLLNPEIYVEIIGDMHHLSKQALQIVFQIKKDDRILLVSDSAAQTTISGDNIPRTKNGDLLGGAMNLAAVVRSLVDEGFDSDLVWRAATTNPESYLRNRV